MPCCIILIKCILKPFPLTSSSCICSALWLNVTHLFLSWSADAWSPVLKNLKRGCKHEGRNHTAGHALSRVNLKITFQIFKQVLKRDNNL